MSTNLRNAHQAVADALGKLSDLFTEDAKLTFVMRVPGFPDRFMVVGDDTDLQAVADTVIRSGERAEQSLAVSQ